nr:MAG TPA: hypothetical protein [Caudoviricetes sp.]DAT79694.1 MAG TPA: hypothetical protein [Caudoviricetes sp.]
MRIRKGQYKGKNLNISFRFYETSKILMLCL